MQEKSTQSPAPGPISRSASEQDATQAFLESLPEIGLQETFRFACHPGVRCFNACCGDLTLTITPYDALRLRRALGEDSRTFITNRGTLVVAPDTGFPLLQLRMMTGPGKPCPFVTAKGCSVYEHRPAACRTYPLGRATRLTSSGNIEQQFFLVREAHCRGFEEERDWTPAMWLTDQGLEDYNRSNDRLTDIMGRQKLTGQPIANRHTNMAFLALYQPDNFHKFIEDMKIFERLDLDEDRKRAILGDEEETLRFAMDWLELALFGNCANLRRKA
ncbi:YkgJ family cysteine cluster protein [Desulfocurvibacter africanus]|uniref:YkgJ family cysteine cluster protein n=1 Tax=Desulfocurvibacter africanus TaxID=873 RepID=UPI0003FB9666|nr:YkgJ family cysteine cluster protein [Desulfocurvibacter africanus]